MFDFGFAEIFLILIVTILFVGPKDIPKVMRTVGRIFRRLQYVRYSLSSQFEDFMRENDLSDIQSQVNFEVQKNDVQYDEAAFDEDIEDFEGRETPPDDERLTETEHVDEIHDPKESGHG